MRETRRRAPRRRRAGMTLVEIMIVVIIMALIATAVGMAVLPALQDARRRQAQADAATMQSAALAYLVQSGRAECPTASELEESGVLNAQTRARDPWDHEFVIECEGDAISVRSMGPDGQLGTEDDVG
jgi:general secretion pathway protein G